MSISGQAHPDPRASMSLGSSSALGGALVMVLACSMFAFNVWGPSTSRGGYIGLLAVIPFAAAYFLSPLPTLAVGLVFSTAATWAAYQFNPVLPEAGIHVGATVVATVFAVVASSYRIDRERRSVSLVQVVSVVTDAILEPLPARVGGVEVGVAYASAAQESELGGDLCAAVALSDGAIFLLGDVRGKGLSALRISNRLLGTFRHMATRVEAGELITHLDAAIIEHGGPEDFATALLVRTHHGHPLRAQVYSAGHPDPLVRDAAGKVRALAPQQRCPPLGLGAQPVVTDLVLQEGESLVMFTDGVTEARHAGNGSFFVPAPALSVPGELSAPAVAALLYEQVQTWSGGHGDDDIAVLVLSPVPTEVPAAIPAP